MLEAVHELLIFPLHRLKIRTEQRQRLGISLNKRRSLRVLVHVVLSGVLFKALRKLLKVVRLVPLVNHLCDKVFAQVARFRCSKAVALTIGLVSGPVTALHAALSCEGVHLSVADQIDYRLVRMRSSSSGVALLRIRSLTVGASGLVVGNPLVLRLAVRSPGVFAFRFRWVNTTEVSLELLALVGLSHPVVGHEIANLEPSRTVRQILL